MIVLTLIKLEALETLVLTQKAQEMDLQVGNG